MGSRRDTAVETNRTFYSNTPSVSPLTHGGWTSSEAGPYPGPQQAYSNHRICVPGLSPGPPRQGPVTQDALGRAHGREVDVS